MGSMLGIDGVARMAYSRCLSTMIWRLEFDSLCASSLVVILWLESAAGWIKWTN